jgi:hypothetical protein
LSEVSVTSRNKRKIEHYPIKTVMSKSGGDGKVPL